MNIPKFLTRLSPHQSSLRFLLCIALVAGLLITDTSAAEWSGIEPFKSRRVDVERALGTPLASGAGEAGTLQFRVAGGTVTVAFVDRRFVETKKLSPDLEGTVLQIILQHEAATDTPESLNLIKNNRFKRESRDGVTVFRNLRDGVFYTFINDRLKTTRYTPTAEQQAGSQKG